jgi:hypothetical protein
MKSQSTSYLPKVTQFLKTFLDATSSDAFFAQYKTDLYVVPFHTGVIAADEWSLDYSAFTSAAALRASEKNDMATFISLIEDKGMK